MSDDGLNLSRRKVLGGITTVGAASAAAGAGTFALFKDSGSTSKQTISTGTVELSDSNPTVANFPTGDLGSSGSIGTTTNPASVSFTYKGNLKADFKIGMKITDPESSGNNKTATEFADKFVLKDATKIVIENKDGDVTSKDYILKDENPDGDSYGELGPAVKNELDESQYRNSDGTWDTVTLADLNGDLPVSSGEPGRNYATVQNGDTVTLDIVASLNNVSDAFEGEKLDIQVFGKVVEA